jgi:hypothetical protein
MERLQGKGELALYVVVVPVRIESEITWRQIRFAISGCRVCERRDVCKERSEFLSLAVAAALKEDRGAGFLSSIDALGGRWNIYDCSVDIER